MAHKLSLIEPKPIVKKERRIKLPNIGGKIGFAIMTGSKEYFFGITVGDVIVEQIVRKSNLKIQKGTHKVFTLD